jgi:hypothetical protein
MFIAAPDGCQVITICLTGTMEKAIEELDGISRP